LHAAFAACKIIGTLNTSPIPQAAVMTKRPLDTLETLAARFGLPRRTLAREIDRGRLPYVSIAGSRRFRERDVEVWLERSGPLPRLRLMQGAAAGSLRDEPSAASSHGRGAS